MQLLVTVINKTEKLDDLLGELVDQGFTGATILSSTGMMRALAKNIENYPIFGTLRFLNDNDREESNTVFMVLRDEQVDTVKGIIRKTLGDLSQPDSAILFTLPVLSTEGI